MNSRNPHLRAIAICALLTLTLSVQAQSFIRSELPTQLSGPWEITYGPDDHLWVTESGGVVSRVDPLTGNKTVVYTALDHFAGSPLEDLALCHQPGIGSGTLGLALHPEFSDGVHDFIYFVHSYNSGSMAAPDTRFRIKRLHWDALSGTVDGDTNLVELITSGYDHLGGRLMAVEQNGIPYLFLTVGDHGISEDNSPTCYSPQSNNPNNFAQDPTTDNGKVHRYNMDGSIPADNPIPGNPFYTRGHRNPQGLMYNTDLEILYDVEHGDRTDDEINILHKGMNYGWKNIRGYHGDDLYAGENAYHANYVPDPSIANDSLVDPFYSWCAVAADTSSQFLDWCTVAPSDGIYYGSSGIPEWTNSLLVVTLKDGLSTDMELYQFQLEPNGELTPSTMQDPNPQKFFAADQALNGRLRDVAVSADGQKIFLINNGGAPTEKITVYTYENTMSVNSVTAFDTDLRITPDPVHDQFTITGINDRQELQDIRIMSAQGDLVKVSAYDGNVNVSDLAHGVYFLMLRYKGHHTTLRFVKY